MTSSVTRCFSVSELAFWKIIWLTAQLSWIFDCVCDNDYKLVQFWKTLWELFPLRTWWLSIYLDTLTPTFGSESELLVEGRGMYFARLRPLSTNLDRPDSDFRIHPWANEGVRDRPSAFEEFWSSDNIYISLEVALSSSVQKRSWTDPKKNLRPASLAVRRSSLSGVCIRLTTPGSNHFTV